jgi:transcriptional regulator with XRE-family HTH domain
MTDTANTTIATYVPLLHRLSRVVRQRREQLGLSQDELAQRSGLHRTYISDIERGARNLSLKNLVRLAEALEVQPSTLVAWVEQSE